MNIFPVRDCIGRKQQKEGINDYYTFDVGLTSTAYRQRGHTLATAVAAAAEAHSREKAYTGMA